MKIRSIRGAAFWIALLTAAAVWGASYSRSVTVTVLAGGAVAFLVSVYMLRRYVLFRIKPIYQILSARNSKIEEIEREMTGKDIPAEIEGSLQQWADKNTSEIARLKENEKYRKDFLGNVSHELKTPLCSIQGYILTLLDGGLEDPGINRKYLEQSQKNIDRLIHIVQELEDISRLEAGTMELSPVSFDLIELVGEVSETLSMQAEKRGITLVCDSGSLNELIVVADRDYIGQVLINLVTNSIKYGREGGRTRVRFMDLFEKIMVEVQDDGIGIDAEHLPRIFERFYRVDKSRSRAAGGTGLGLAIVKHILEAHRETITVRSQPEAGTTFSFTLTKASPENAHRPLVGDFPGR